MAITTPIITAAIGAVATVASKPSTPNMPKAPEAPKLPQTPTMAATANKADEQAKTAGGSILSDQRQNQQIGDGAGVRKQLLGL